MFLTLVADGKVRELSRRGTGLFVLAVDIVGHFAGHGGDESLDLALCPLGRQSHPTIGQVLPRRRSRESVWRCRVV